MRDELNKVLSEYTTARAQPFGAHPLARHVRHELARAVRDAIGEGARELKIAGRPGQGGWAHVPWVGLLDPLITEAWTRGVYACYLFPYDMSGLVLSLQLGTEELRARHSRTTALQIILAQAETLRNEMPPSPRLSHDPISLRHPEGAFRAESYEPAHVLGRTYQLPLPEEAILVQDARELLHRYTNLRGTVHLPEEAASDAMLPNHVHLGAEDLRRMRVHLRAERNTSIARKVKQQRPPVCELCGFDFGKTYGAFADGYIEAHHLTPFSQLPRDRPVPLTSDDFTVLCANCHRAVHLMGDPDAMAKLQRRLCH